MYSSGITLRLGSVAWWGLSRGSGLWQRFDYHGGTVKQCVHVEGIIEASIQHRVRPDLLGVPEQVVPRFALNDPLIGGDPATLNPRLCRGQNHGLRPAVRGKSTTPAPSRLFTRNFAFIH